jgi:hypothetical protein
MPFCYAVVEDMCGNQIYSMSYTKGIRHLIALEHNNPSKIITDNSNPANDIILMYYLESIEI